MGGSKNRSSGQATPVRRRRGQALTDSEARLTQLEHVLDVLIQASLRGQLTADDRRLLIKHMAIRKNQLSDAAAHVAPNTDPVCPACRLPLPKTGRARKRCPHCLVLLGEVRKSKGSAAE